MSTGKERPTALRRSTGSIASCTWKRYPYIYNAIAREKYLKHCLRAEKIALIEAMNPTWDDIAGHYLAAYPNEKTAGPPPSAKDDKMDYKQVLS